MSNKENKTERQKLHKKPRKRHCTMEHEMLNHPALIKERALELSFMSAEDRKIQKDIERLKAKEIHK